MAATTAAIKEFITDCADNRITPYTHTVASITMATESENRVGTSVEVPSTPLRVQNDAPEPLGGEKDPAPIGLESPRQVNLSKLSSLESNFGEGYNSDGDRGPWCDLIGLKGEQDYDEDEIHKTQVEGVIEEEGVNVSEDCAVDTDSANKETEDPPPLPVDYHITIEEDAVNKMKIPELKEELKGIGHPLLGNKGALVERLLSTLATKITVVNGKNPKPKKIDTRKSGGGMKFFPDTAYWRILKPKDETVDEPNNTTF